MKKRRSAVTRTNPHPIRSYLFQVFRTIFWHIAIFRIGKLVCCLFEATRQGYLLHIAYFPSINNATKMGDEPSVIFSIMVAVKTAFYSLDHFADFGNSLNFSNSLKQMLSCDFGTYYSKKFEHLLAYRFLSFEDATSSVGRQTWHALRAAEFSNERLLLLRCLNCLGRSECSRDERSTCIRARLLSCAFQLVVNRYTTA